MHGICINIMSDKYLPAPTAMFHSDTSLLALPVSWESQTHWTGYTRPPFLLNHKLSLSVKKADARIRHIPILIEYMANVENMISSWRVTSKSTLIIHSNFLYIWS